MYLYNAQMEIKDVLAMPSTIKRSLQVLSKGEKIQTYENAKLYSVHY